jgi:hypothetical protein
MKIYINSLIKTYINYLMKNILYFLDFLGFQASLTVQGQERFKTLFTGFLSLLVIMLSIVCIIYFGWDLVERDNPVVLNSFRKFPDFGPLGMSNKEYLFIFAMEAQNYSFYNDPTYFSVSGSYFIKKNIIKEGKISEYLESGSVEVKTCSTYYNDSDIIEKNIKFPLDMFYCVKPSNLTLNGFFGSDNYSLLKISVDKCVNTTQNGNKCKPQEVIDNMIQGGFISIDQTDALVDQKNYAEPIKRVFANSYNLLNANSSLYFSYHIYPITFESDYGLLFQDFKTYTGWGTKTSIFNKISRSDNIVTFSLEGYATGPLYIRSYIKIQTVMTQIGGFIKSLTIIASILSSFISKSYFYIHYISEIGINLGIRRGRNETNSKKTSLNIPSNFSYVPSSPIQNLHRKRESCSSQKLINLSPMGVKRKASKIILNYLYDKIFFCKKKSFKTFMTDNLKMIFAQNLSFENLSKKCLEIDILKTALKDIDFEAEYKMLLERKIKANLNVNNQIK